MRFMPDSAILGTVGHVRRRTAKARHRGYGYDLSDMVPSIAGVIALGWFVVAVVIAALVFG